MLCKLLSETFSTNMTGLIAAQMRYVLVHELRSMINNFHVTFLNSLTTSAA
jgi:hypothetical protein